MNTISRCRKAWKTLFQCLLKMGVLFSKGRYLLMLKELYPKYDPFQSMSVGTNAPLSLRRRVEHEECVKYRWSFFSKLTEPFIVNRQYLSGSVEV